MAKSQAEIRARRALKNNVVELLVKCAETAPHGPAGSVLTEDEMIAIQLLVSQFLQGCSGTDQRTLQTAKGCTAPPPMLRVAHNARTLLDFLNLLVRGEDIGCASQYVREGIDWAQHVAAVNPNSLINWQAKQLRINVAVKTLEADAATYAKDPLRRAPVSVKEAEYWLRLRAYYAAGATDQEKQIAWSKDFEDLPSGVRKAVGIRAIKKAGVAASIKLAKKWYKDVLEDSSSSEGSSSVEMM